MKTHMAWDDRMVFCGRKLFEGISETFEWKDVTCERCLAGKNDVGGGVIKHRILVNRGIVR